MKSVAMQRYSRKKLVFFENVKSFFFFVFQKKSKILIFFGKYRKFIFRNLRSVQDHSLPKVTLFDVNSFWLIFLLKFSAWEWFGAREGRKRFKRKLLLNDIFLYFILFPQNYNFLLKKNTPTMPGIEIVQKKTLIPD